MSPAPGEQSAPRRLSRRTVAQGAAWSVPVIVVGAPVKALAASAPVGAIVAHCDPVPREGSFDILVEGTTSAQVRILLELSGAAGASYSFVRPPGWTIESSTATTRSILAPVSGGSVSGTITVNFTLPTSSTATLTATLSTTSGEILGGVLVASITKIRNGNSNNYGCSTT